MGSRYKYKSTDTGITKTDKWSKCATRVTWGRAGVSHR